MIVQHPVGNPDTVFLGEPLDRVVVDLDPGDAVDGKGDDRCRDADDQLPAQVGESAQPAQHLVKPGRRGLAALLILYAADFVE